MAVEAGVVMDEFEVYTIINSESFGNLNGDVWVAAPTGESGKSQVIIRGTGQPPLLFYKEMIMRIDFTIDDFLTEFSAEFIFIF